MAFSQLAETGLPTYEGPASLLEVLHVHGMPGLPCMDLRQLSQLSKAWRRDMEDESAWRMMCGALAKECGLYAPRECASWRKLFLECLWPARGKWREEKATSIDFRIRVAVRVKPRNGSSRHDGMVLPLHQRLKMLKKGEKLTFADAALDQTQMAEALKDQADLPPELLQALLEAQQLAAVSKQAQSQANSGRRHAFDESGMEVEEGSAAALSAAAAAAAAEVATPLTEAERNSINAAEAAFKEKGKDGDKKAELDKEDKENGDESSRRCGNAKLLLVQPSRVIMFVPGCGVRPFLFSTVCGEKASQLEVYHKVAQDAVCSALNGLNACVLAYGQTGAGKSHTVFGPSGALEQAAIVAAAGGAGERRRYGWAMDFSMGGMSVSEGDGLGACTVLPESAGIVLRACEELLSCHASPGPACDALTLSAQYVQIYDERVTDLLSGSPVTVRDVGAGVDVEEPGKPPIVLQGAAHVTLTSLADALALLRAGELHKRVAATAMNDTSSRAHTIFLLQCTQRGGDGDALLSSQLALVDLAGCEQVKQSKVAGQRMREAIGINSCACGGSNPDGLH